MRASLQSALELLYQPGSMSSAPCELLEQHGILLLVPHQHKKEAYRQLLAAEAMKQDFLEAARVLQERQIPFVPIKGLLLAHLLYGDYALRGSSDIDLANWSLIVANAPAYVFPASTPISAGGYLVVWCDTNNAAPGLHTGARPC